MQTFASLKPLQQTLNTHPVYGALRSMAHLRCFMSHHIYSVWDFMSLVKYLQGRVAPVAVPWAPVGDAAVRRFINEIVMEEESDETPAGKDGKPGFASHFELYCGAMAEIGADAQPALAFVETAGSKGIEAALASGLAPAPSQAFMRATFGFIAMDKPHVAAAAFSWGREHVIPGMFRACLAQMGINASQAPLFHYYLERHIHLDEDYHAPLSLRMVEILCGDDPVKIGEAEAAAVAALQARIAFWDGVHAALKLI